MTSQLERLIGGEPRNRQMFPLLLEFELHPPTGEPPMIRVAGFRDWSHYHAYVAQMFERNKIKVRRPKQIDEALQS